ncbi:transglutaminase-like domain-containing protein [Clostridium sp. Marseille-P2415]|uniref:transglutaminase-like domain-containing protein n=1 Tax=Clostridium sp. Marseille-P2415 TaxID=1805471 RepID=UPI0009888AF9|nr:transglutaminase-like domain-containing protein [Clostridium sp. Marseille-P2415]
MKKNGIAMASVCAAILFSLNGCTSGDRITAADSTEESIEWKTVVSIGDEAVPLYSKPEGSNVKTPKASGTVTLGSNSAAVDASNTSHGYVMVRYTGSASKIKVQVIKGGGETYTYDLNARSAYEVFPLTEGNGTYTVRVLEQVQGTQYAVKSSNDIHVTLADEFEPFLYPNQYVNFSAGSAVVKKGAELAAPASDALGVVTNVYNFVIKNFTYDTALANSVESGYRPDVDDVLARKKGICFDYAAVMTAMLRSQNIPTKLVVGYTGSLYHAWVNVYIEGQGWVDNIIYFDGYNWKLMDPTFASSGGNDPAIREYIKDSSNYKAKYTY